eukprot:5235943-Pleurochrysis_carterae.AAC.5
MTAHGLRRTYAHKQAHTHAHEQARTHEHAHAPARARAHTPATALMHTLLRFRMAHTFARPHAQAPITLASVGHVTVGAAAVAAVKHADGAVVELILLPGLQSIQPHAHARETMWRSRAKRFE